MRTTGYKIQLMREKRNLTQKEFASMLKISQGAVSQLEREYSEDVQVSTILKLSRLLKVSPEYFLIKRMTPEQYFELERLKQIAFKLSMIPEDERHFFEKQIQRGYEEAMKERTNSVMYWEDPAEKVWGYEELESTSEDNKG